MISLSSAFPVPEIARALEIPLNTAYSRLRLARQDFAKAVKEWTTQPYFISPLVDHLPRFVQVSSIEDHRLNHPPAHLP